MSLHIIAIHLVAPSVSFIVSAPAYMLQPGAGYNPSNGGGCMLQFALFPSHMDGISFVTFIHDQNHTSQILDIR